MIYAIGMVLGNHVDSYPYAILLLDISVVAVLLITKVKYRARFLILMISLMFLHLSVIFRPENYRQMKKHQRYHQYEEPGSVLYFGN